jgi:hypothetical protein
VRDVVFDGEKSASARIMEYLSKEYPVYPSMLRQMLLKDKVFPSVPIVEYTAKTFVTERRFLKFLDKFLKDRPLEMYHYVRSCIKAGSLEFLKLRSFMNLHYHDDGFNIDYFLGHKQLERLNGIPDESDSGDGFQV